MPLEKTCSYCKSSRYKFCKRHIPVDQLYKIGWMVEAGKRSSHKSRKLIKLQDFMKLPEAFKRPARWHWVPYLDPSIMKATADPNVECAGDKECFIFKNRGFYCKKHGK